MTIKQFNAIEELVKTIEMLDAPRVVADYAVQLLETYIGYENAKMVDKQIRELFDEIDKKIEIKPESLKVELSKEAKDILNNGLAQRPLTKDSVQPIDK